MTEWLRSYFLVKIKVRFSKNAYLSIKKYINININVSSTKSEFISNCRGIVKFSIKNLNKMLTATLRRPKIPIFEFQSNSIFWINLKIFYNICEKEKKKIKAILRLNRSPQLSKHSVYFHRMNLDS